MASRKKRRQENTRPSAASETSIRRTLAPDIMLEVVARSDLPALVRCAAACKALRRDILCPSFIRRIKHLAPCILASLGNAGVFTLVHPATPAATSLCYGHLFPFFFRRAADLFDQYSVVSSRRGLVLLRRITIPTISIDSRSDSDLCVYDPMTGAQTFLSLPPENDFYTSTSCRKYVLLTAADGIDIDSSFQLLVVDLDIWCLKVQTASSCGTWGASAQKFHWVSLRKHRDPVVLHGGVIHWLIAGDKQVLSYNLGTGKLGWVNLPPTNNDFDKLHLAASLDGKLLKLLVIQGFMMSVWLHIPTSLEDGSAWSLETMIDMEEKLRSLYPHKPPYSLDKVVIFDDSLKRNGVKSDGDVVLLRVPVPGYYDSVTVFSLETKDMHTQTMGSSLLEIDLLSYLRNMKIFSETV